LSTEQVKGFRRIYEPLAGDLCGVGEKRLRKSDGLAAAMQCDTTTPPRRNH
jgi:hypothetical protein